MHRLGLFVVAFLVAATSTINPAAADDRGVCFKIDSPPDAAISACGRLISSGRIIGGNLSVVYEFRGSAYFKKHDYDRAIADFGEAIRLNPKFALAYSSRSRAYSGKGDFDRAIADASEAIRLDVKHVGAYVGRGFAFTMQRRFDDAIRDLDEAIRLQPNLAVAYSQRGVALREKGEFDRALADLNEAIRLSPRSITALVNRGLIHEQKGDVERARSDFATAASLDDVASRLLMGPGLLETARSRLAALERRKQQKAAAATSTAAATPPNLATTSTAAATPPNLTATTTAAAPSPNLAASPAPAGPRVALVIGNGDYRHASRLANPANDATDIAQALRRLGFDVVEGRDLDRRGMENKVREFGRKLDGAALALFFYAGHGLQVGGKNYLVPIDAKLERAGDLNFETIDVGNVLAQMETEKRVNLVLLDACRDNPLARSFARSLGTRSTSVGQGLASIQSAIGTMIAYATQPDNVALDGTGRNSPFTAALLKHIGTPGLDIGVVMRRVRTDVIAATLEKQVPWDHSSLTGEVILAR
jgi:tetratricopeptide (TPR) repeat protein